METVQIRRADEQWLPREDSEEDGVKAPSRKQLAYIEALSREAGVKVNLERIESSEQASRLIEALKQMSGRASGNGVDLRDKRVAFGMATKLVFKKYTDGHRDYRKAKGFWNEVEQLYRAYQEKQEQAVRGTAKPESMQMEEALHGALFPNGEMHYKTEKQEKEIKNGGGMNGAA